MKLPLCLLTLLAALAPLHAATEQTITFAVPEVEGRISLGVYDANKKLVRTLATGATDQDFKIGLNGLITTWDGKNDAGEPLPAGKYTVKGYVVSDKVKSEGEAFHFNDWVTDEDDPRLANPRVVWAKGDEVDLKGDTVLPDQENNDGSKRQLSALVRINVNGVPGPVLIRGEDLTAFPPPGSSAQPTENAPPQTFVDTSGSGTISTDGLVVSTQKSKEAAPEKVSFSEPIKINSLSAGVGETFWIVAQPIENGTPGASVVRQYSFDGALLRQIAGDFPATTIFADKTENRIYLTHVEGATTTIKGLRPVEAKTDAAPAATATPAPVAEPTDAPKTADWEVFLEKTSTLCPKFGLVDGKLVPDAGATEQKDSIRLDLPPSTMDQQQHTLVIHVKGNQDGEIWATGSGGLRLALVGKLPGVNRIVVAKGEKAGEIKVYAGNGVVVAEYSVSGLNEIAEINAGEIELP